MKEVSPSTSLGEANEQLRADMRWTHWSLSVGFQVRVVKDKEGNPMERKLLVHVEPAFVGPRREGVPRLMSVNDFARLMGWVVGPRNTNIFNRRLTRNKFKNRR